MQFRAVQERFSTSLIRSRILPTDFEATVADS